MTTVKGTPQQGLFAATLGFFIGFAAVSLFGPTAHSFKDAMGLSPLLVGLLVAMPALSGSLLRIPFSAWVDTTGGRTPFLVLLGLSLVGMTGLLVILVAWYPDRMSANFYPLLVLFALLCGCGIATFSVGIGQVSYWFPQNRQGVALGAFAGIGNIAPGLFAFLIPLALAAWGLVGSYLAWLIFLALGTAVYAATGRNAWFFQLRAAGTGVDQARSAARSMGQELFPTGTVKESLVVAAKIWKTWTLVIIYFTTFGGFIALTAWLPTYWREFLGCAGVMAGTLTALYSILTSVARVFGGALADRKGGEISVLLGLLVMAAGAVVMIAAHAIATAVAGEVVLALGMGVANAAVFKLVPQEVPQAVGAAAGWVGGLGAFGGFAIPPLMAAFVKVLGPPGYARGFLVLLGLALGLEEPGQPGAASAGQPIAWIKVHNLQEFVYFDHSSHVLAGVDCQRCHGPVERMERVRQVESLGMGWCVDCHRAANRDGVKGRRVNATTDCVGCHF